MEKPIKITGRPSPELIEKEIKRRKSEQEFLKSLLETLQFIIVISAVSVLISTLMFSVLRVSRSSMAPTFYDGEIIITLRHAGINRGDVIAFYYNNKLLVKRVIAMVGDWVDIDEDGVVYVNENALDEPYVRERSLGTCDIELPYQVPDHAFFMMGDQRATSIDSRTRDIGPIEREMIEGKVVLRIWPLTRLKLF